MKLCVTPMTADQELDPSGRTPIDFMLAKGVRGGFLVNTPGARAQE